MKFMCMHKVDAKMEAGEPPSQTIIEKMGQFVGRHLKSGVFLDGAGLHRSARRVRVSLGSGKPTIERGPYAGRNELIAGFAMVTATSEDHAIELATALARAAGEPEIEIGPVVEGWDLTGKPRPADAPLRFLLVRKGDAAFERGTPESSAVTALLDQWKRDGVLASAAKLTPSAQGSRSRVAGGKRAWFDGPFAESKELIAGFSIVELPTLDDAKRLADDYSAILGDNEVDIRPIA